MTQTGSCGFRSLGFRVWDFLRISDFGIRFSYSGGMSALHGAPGPETVLAGTLHLYVAFDWGDELDLERARQLVPAEVHELPRRRRTPPSIAYRPPPLRF